MRKIKKNSFHSDALAIVENALAGQGIAISSMSVGSSTIENDFDCGEVKLPPGQYVIVDVKVVLRVKP